VPELQVPCTWTHFTADCLSAWSAHVSMSECVGACVSRSFPYYYLWIRLWLTFIFCGRCLGCTTPKSKGSGSLGECSSSFTTDSLRAKDKESAVKVEKLWSGSKQEISYFAKANRTTGREVPSLRDDFYVSAFLGALEHWYDSISSHTRVLSPPRGIIKKRH